MREPQASSRRARVGGLLIWGADYRSRVWHMTSASLRKRCLEAPEAVEEFPFGPRVSVFKVSGKMFALSDLKARPLRVSLKCDPVLARELRDTYEAVAPGYHLNKQHWNTVTLDGSLSDRIVSDLIEDSYDLVVAGLPKATQERIRIKAAEGA
jgi:predicted DNA-binding protein (MmcQ/YjbR family)